ncbi:MAG: phage portal protein [Allorhizobium sp.]
MPIASGIRVTPESAMRCTAVSCAVRRITETLGTLPIHVYRRSQDGSRQRAPDHPVYRLVNGRVSSWRSSSELVELMTADALLHGAGFAVIVRNGEDLPRGLDYLPAPAVTVEENAATGDPIYRVRLQSGSQRTYPASDILHLRSPLGSVIHQGREAIGLALVLERAAAHLFKNGARPGGVVEHPAKLDATSFDNLLTAFRTAFSGEGTGLPAVLDHGATYKNITLSSTDAQFIEHRKFALQEIARIFCMPLVLLQDYDRATWSNSEEMGRQFLTYTLAPWIRRWEDEIHLKLFSEADQAGFYAEFLIDELLRGDVEKRTKAYAVQIAARMLSPNEARAMENRAPYAGGDKFENPNTTSALASPLTADKEAA